jgi:hypothetical protein
VDEATRSAERIELEAVEDFCAAPPESLKSALGLGSERIGGALVALLPQAPDPVLNRVIGLGVQSPANLPELDEMLGRFRAAGVQRYFVHLTPGAEPRTLAAELEARGLQRYRRSWAKFVWAGGGLPTPHPGLRVALAGPEHAESFAKIVASAFGMPPPLEPLFAALVGRERWRIYLCFDGETPFAAGALFVHDGAAWLGFGATLTSHRGRGGQTAILAQRVRDALALGCRSVTTETGEEVADQPQISYRNIVRTGFRVHYVRENYAPK